MSLFFEVTPADVVIVAKRLNHIISEEQAVDIMCDLDLDFDKDCQSDTYLQSQTNTVYSALEKQLKEYFDEQITL